MKPGAFAVAGELGRQNRFDVLRVPGQYISLLGPDLDLDAVRTLRGSLVEETVEILQELVSPVGPGCPHDP